MNRRNFLKLAGLTALASVVAPNEVASGNPPIYRYHSDGRIDIIFDSNHFSPSDSTKDLGKLNPNAIVFNDLVYKRGELLYTGCSGKLQKHGYWETTYNFVYKPGGHHETKIYNHEEHGMAISFNAYEFAEGNNLKQNIRRIENVKGINRR